MITQQRLHELFDYVDGELIRRGKRKKGGTVSTRGYKKIGVDYKIYGEHQLVFLHHHGYLPEQIDHIDGNKLNNKIENLRAADNSKNMMNRELLRNNTSGAKGVFWDREYNKWRVAVRSNGVLRSFGRYIDFELAELVATEAREKYHGVFANHGTYLSLGV